MRIYSVNELSRLSRAELFQLYARIITKLPQLPEGSFDCHAAQTNLRNLRHALSHPRPG